MLRKFFKLRRAQRALREGRYDLALELAEDPDIAGHVKTQALRQAALEAVSARAAELEDEGEISRALAEIEKVAQRSDSVTTRRREQELMQRKKEQEELDSRHRARLYRARLELGRGDLAAARQAVESIDPKSRNEEMDELLAEVRQREERCGELVLRAGKLCFADPAAAEALLIDAAKQNPRGDGLNQAFRELAHARVEHFLSSRVGDAAVLSFLMEWSIFRRRHLDGLHGALEEDEQRLRRFLQKRVEQHLGRGALEPAERLLERTRETLGLNGGLEELALGVSRLKSAGDKAARGEFDAAEDDLRQAGARLGRRFKPVLALEKNIKKMSRDLAPLKKEADVALQKGDIRQGKLALLKILERLPGHSEALRLLEVVNEKEARNFNTLTEIRQLMDEGRLEKARRLLDELFAAGGDSEQISSLMKELEVLKTLRGAETPQTRPNVGPGDAGAAKAPDAAAPTGPASRGPVGPAWILSVEEHGEHLVVEGEEVVIGNSPAQSADVQILANIASRHARIVRRTSFHGGLVFKIEPVNGREVFINGTRSPGQQLCHNDEVRLGRDFRFVFKLPSERSRAALLEIRSGHDAFGARDILLMPPGGRAGALRIGPSEEAHVTTFGFDSEAEIYRDQQDELVMVSTAGVQVDGDESRARGVLEEGSRARAGDLVVHVRNILPGP